MFRFLALAFALGSLCGVANAATPGDTSGTWLTEDGRARIRIEKCGAAADRICGYVVWLKVASAADGSPKLDAKNPDASKRGRAALGVQLLQGLKANADGRFEGEIYNADDGKNYDVTIWSEAQDEIKVRGCLVSFLCKTQSWPRVSDVAPGQLAGLTGGQNGPRPEPAYAKALPGAVATKAAPRKPAASAPPSSAVQPAAAD